MRTQTLVTLLCILALGGPAWASGKAAAGSPCPAEPPVASELKAGKYVEVNAALQQEVSKNPNNAQATLWLARSYLDLGQYNHAVSLAERAVHLAPNCSESHFVLARSYGMKANRARSFWLARKARQEYETAIQLNPDNLVARRDLMEFYLQAPWILGGSKDKAMAQVKAIASRSAMQGDLARAVYWEDLNKRELAAREFQKVLAAKPDTAEPYFLIADFYEFDRKPAEVRAAVQAASAIVPRDPRVDYYRAVVNVMEDRSLDQAEQDLKSYLARAPRRDDFPSHAEAHDWLGQIYQRWGKTQQAIGQYRHALQLNPDNQAAHAALQRLDSN